MSIEEYKTLQIGMYVTDSKKAKVSLVCSDFYLIKEFKKRGMAKQASLDITEAPYSREEAVFPVWVRVERINEKV